MNETLDRTKPPPTPNPSPYPHNETIDPLLAVMASIPEMWQASGGVFEPNHQTPIYRMTKTELLSRIDDLLEWSIEAYEVTDLKLEETDVGTLHTINVCLEQAIEAFRRARRSGRVLLEEYNDDLSKKPEYMEQGGDEDEDEDEDSLMQINRDLPIKQVLIDFVAETQTRAIEDRELLNYLQGAYNPLPNADSINSVIREVMSYIELIANQIGPIDRACLAPPSIDTDDNDNIPS